MSSFLRWGATLLLWLILASAHMAAIEPVKNLHPTGYLNDFVGVVDPASAQEITALAQQVDQKAKVQIAVVTVHSLDGADIESYASDLFKQWGIGGKNTNRGVLVLLAVDDHRYRTEVGYGLEPILPDGKVGGFWRDAVPLLKQNQYGPALAQVTRQIAETIAADAGVTLEVQSSRPPPRPHSQSDESFPLLWLILFI